MCQKNEEWIIQLLNKTCLLRAKKAASVSLGAIYDAGILIENGIIKKIDKFHNLKKTTLAYVYEVEDCILLPCLINPHLHLELSFLKNKLPRNKGFIAWVKKLLELKTDLKEKEKVCLAKKEARFLKQKGVVALGDVSNSLITKEIFKEEGFLGYLFKEYLWDTQIIEEEFKEHNFILPSCHSVFLNGKEMIKKIKKICNKKNGVFSIHCAETYEEIEFIKYGRGELAELLKERGRLKEDFKGIGLTPVQYLYSLGVLDNKTLLIHCVYLEEEDWEIIKKAGAWVCLCPKSNEFIGVGKAPSKKLFDAGIKLCLGTDSLASNDSLYPLEELMYFLDKNPWCSPALGLSFISLNAGKALGLDNLGDIKEGFKGIFVCLSSKSKYYPLFE